MLPAPRAPRRRAPVPGEPRAASAAAQRRADPPRRRPAARAGLVRACLRRATSGAIVPLLARRARLRLTVSDFSAARAARPARRRRPTSCTAASDRPSGRTPTPPEPRAAHGLGRRPYVLTVGSRTARKNLAALRRRRPAPGRPRRRPRRRRRRAAAVPRRGRRARGCATSATSTTPSCPGSTRAPRRSCCPRATRATACPCWRRWPAGRPWSPRVPAALPETGGDAAPLRRPRRPGRASPTRWRRALDDPERQRAAGLARAAGPRGRRPRARSTRSCAASWADRRRRAGLSARGLEAHDAVLLDLDDRARVEQQVDVAEHLGQRQVGLGDRDVAPQRLRELVGGARPLGDEARDLLRRGARARARRSSMSARWSVDRLAVARRRRPAGPSRASRAASAR